jgi:hypothetical protein
MEESKERGKVGCLSFSLYFLDYFLKMIYLENRLSILQTVFTFEILASRSLKLYLMLINFFVFVKLLLLYF